MRVADLRPFLRLAGDRPDDQPSTIAVHCVHQSPLLYPQNTAPTQHSTAAAPPCPLLLCRLFLLEGLPSVATGIAMAYTLPPDFQSSTFLSNSVSTILMLLLGRLWVWDL